MAYDRYARGGDNPWRLDIDTLDMPKAQPVARRDRAAEEVPLPPRRPKKLPAADTAPVTTAAPAASPPPAFPTLPLPPDVGPVEIPGIPPSPVRPIEVPTEVPTEVPNTGTIMDPQFRTDLPAAPDALGRLLRGLSAPGTGPPAGRAPGSSGYTPPTAPTAGGPPPTVSAPLGPAPNPTRRRSSLMRPPAPTGSFGEWLTRLLGGT